MNAFLLVVLQTIVKTLVGSVQYEQIKNMVLGAELSGLSGADKRQRVLEEVRNIGMEIGTALLNLAIETAVNSVRK